MTRKRNEGRDFLRDMFIAFLLLAKQRARGVVVIRYFYVNGIGKKTTRKIETQRVLLYRKGMIIARGYIYIYITRNERSTYPNVVGTFDDIIEKRRRYARERRNDNIANNY